jgi:hypothetical protein
MDIKEKTFDNVHENFKKICTEKGINTQALADFIINSINLLPEEEKLNFLEYLIVEEVIMCTNNIYEATGVLSVSKARYLDIMKIDFDEEENNENNN